MTGQKYVRTDIASESPLIEKEGRLKGVSVGRENIRGIPVTTVRVRDSDGEKLLGKPVGTYITVDFGKVWLLPEDKYEAAVDATAGKIRYLSSEYVSGDNAKTVLIAGLGNRFITSDSVGPMTVKGINVTRHIKKMDENLFRSLRKKSVAAISPGVVGQTGIDTCDLIRGAVESVEPDLLVVVDALASKSVDRLASTVQICDTGISPGSGIGNTVKAINRVSMGVPVIAVGAPTMVNSSTLVYDALEKAGISDVNENLVNILENGKSFFVTLNESDVVISSLSSLISDSLNKAFSCD